MRSITLVLIFGFGIALGLIAGAAYLNRPPYHPHEKKAQETACNDGPDWVRWADLTAQWFMAVGTVALFGLTLYYNRKTLRHAVDSSNKALAETKRSVDAVVDAERGSLVLIGSYRTVKDLNTVLFQFRNLGRSDLTIIGFGTHMQAVERATNMPKAPPVIRYTAINHIMKPNDDFGSNWGTLPEAGHAHLVIPNEVLNELRAGKTLACSFGFLYVCSFGHYTACLTYYIPHGPDEVALAYFVPDTLRYDRPSIKA